MHTSVKTYVLQVSRLFLKPKSQQTSVSLVASMRYIKCQWRCKITPWSLWRTQHYLLERTRHATVSSFRSLLATSYNQHQSETTMGPIVAFPSETRPKGMERKLATFIGLTTEQSHPELRMTLHLNRIVLALSCWSHMWNHSTCISGHCHL